MTLGREAWSSRGRRASLLRSCYPLSGTMKIRGLTKVDYDYIISVLDQWWGGPAGRRADPMFFYEFGEHALVADLDGQVIGFLLGVMAPTPSATGYVHLVGIHPDHRRRGVGKRLYTEFTERCRAAGMKRIKSLGSAGHEGPVEFHEAMGFESTEVPDYAGPGRSRVVFVKEL